MQFDKDIISQHAELFMQARKILLANSGVAEIKKPRITTYSFNNSALCHMRTMAHGVDFGFLKGAKLKDEFQRLTGKGKLLRILSLPDLNTPNQELLDYYLTQALDLNH